MKEKPWESWLQSAAFDLAPTNHQIMRSVDFKSFLFFALVTFFGFAHAEDAELARKKCVTFGFKDKTPSHDTCMKQYLQAIGSTKATAKPTSKAASPLPPSRQVDAGTPKADSVLAQEKRRESEAKQEAQRVEALRQENVKRNLAMARATGKTGAPVTPAPVTPEPPVPPVAPTKPNPAPAIAPVIPAATGAATATGTPAPRTSVPPLARLPLVTPPNADPPARSSTPGQIIKDCADCPEMVVIPAGSFTMGSGATEQNIANAAGLKTATTARESPRHRVKLRSFAAGRYAISKGDFALFVRAKGYQTEAESGDGCLAWNGNEFKKDTAYNWRNAGFDQDDNHPVVCVSWNDTQAYIGWLNQSSGQTYRLLSESEREYAARAGGETAFWWGDSISTAQANYDGTATSYNDSPKGEYRQATVPVNSFSPNPFGLYNVHGNVWEWVEDCWHPNYSGAPADGSPWTTTCSANLRVLRGGSWSDNPPNLRSAIRIGGPPDGGSIDFGLRLARTLFAP